MEFFTRRSVVGIFSRESEESYKWLTERLLEFVKDVRTVYISNNFLDLRNHTEKCDFAILYHSKNRGRVNVTDVTDSLYDKELEYLSGTLGKGNVLVVIDDLDDSSDWEKNEILTNQKSIGRWAQDLFLFNQEEKSSPDNESVSRKMDKMKMIIRGWIPTRDVDTTYVTRGGSRGIYCGCCARCCNEVCTSQQYTCLRRKDSLCCILIFVVVVSFILMIVGIAEAWEKVHGEQNLPSSTMSSITTYLTTNITKATAKP